jgi:hypothetical protein
VKPAENAPILSTTFWLRFRAAVVKQSASHPSVCHSSGAVVAYSRRRKQFNTAFNHVLI